MSVTTGQIMRYALLPGIIPRVFAFFSSGFSHIALYMAYVYKNVGLLPDDHPYLNPANASRYGIRHVIFEAKRNLIHSRHNIDQIIIFYTLLVGIIILFLQFFILLTGLVVPNAYAGIGAYYAFFFVTQDPTYDIAFRLLDLTFGFAPAPYTIFNSCAVQGVQCQLAFAPGGGFTPVGPTYTVPNGIHTALHTLFHFYNYGILVVAFMIGGYMIVTIVGETAQSGTPFGKRFNGMWAPLRLVIAIALLTPLSFGMNGAQLLTLVIANWGSSLATNGWTQFMTNLTGVTPLGVLSDELVAQPEPPAINNLIEFAFVALTCMHYEEMVNRRDVEAYHVFGTQNSPFVAGGFNQALTNANYGDIVIRFGEENAVEYENLEGYVRPVCGEIIFQTKGITRPGAMQMQSEYYDLLEQIWTDPLFIEDTRWIAERFAPTVDRDPNADLPTVGYVVASIDYFFAEMYPAIQRARDAEIASQWNYDYLSLGWAGAAMWYQKVAEHTGSLYSSLFGMPTPRLYPETMEEVKEQRRIQNDFVEGQERYNPQLSNGQMIEFADPRVTLGAQAYYYAQQIWWEPMLSPSSNAFKDSIVSVFGLQGLFDMDENFGVHPLAQLVGVGRSLVESAITNLGFSFGSGVTGGIATILGQDLVGSVAMAAASFAGQIALIGLSIGFILYYILPFLPFIYFFFAVGGWIKGIFEAMVGLPLWAIAHIRIDGEGLPGPAAMNGYYLVFEIFIRPILIIFGLLAGILIFSAQVEILNEIWQLVTSNLLGFDSVDNALYADNPTGPAEGIGVGPVVGSIEYLRGHADQLFHTIMYAILVYMLAMASFKLIDLIPNNILRWIGASVSTFAEQAGDPAANLVQYSFMGSQMALGPLNSGMQGLAMRAGPR